MFYNACVFLFIFLFIFVAKEETNIANRMSYFSFHTTRLLIAACR